VSSNSRRIASLELLTFAVHKRILTATLKGLSEGVRRMESVVERVYAKLSAVLLKHPNLRTRLAEQTRSAARNMVLRFDVHGRWKDMEQDRHRHSISPHSQMIQACGTIAPLPEPPPAYVLREIRDQVLNDADQALVLTVIYNSVVDTGLQIDPWAGIDRDDVDERALMFFQLEAYDAQGDGFGLDPCGVESKDSPLLPCDEPTLLHFVSNLTNFASDQSPATHVKLRENDVEADAVVDQVPADPPKPLAEASTSQEAPLNYDALPQVASCLAIAKAKCQSAEVKAWMIEQYAIQKNGSFKNLPATFAWIEDHFDKFGEDIPDDLREYEVPSLDTWRRQVTSVRKATGTNVNTPRAGRSHGLSTVKVAEI